ncbi:hypothetical protein UZ36_01565 [Candidatus Nitromaritima sp. SCGC AAA799-C22]|nr:hypothetical protein UZ36_01565 [Candidatus Nitromaritima sp. SCGC AAA799-C22]
MEFKQRFIILFLVVPLTGMAANVAAFKGDEDYHREILVDIKKINSRLVILENDKLKSLQSIQESLLRQIDEIKNSIQQIQATGELDKSEMIANIGKVSKKIADMEGHIKLELMPEMEKQKDATIQLKSSLDSQYDQLKNALATDMEKLSKANKQYFMDFNAGNTEKLQQIVQALNDQNENLKKTRNFFQVFFRDDLIPALEKQNNESRQFLMAEMAKANTEQNDSLKANHEKVVASLLQMDEKNKNLIEILKKNVMVDEETKALAETLQLNIEDTNKNINQTRKTIAILQEVLSQRLMDMAQEQVASEARMAETLQKNSELTTSNLQVADEKINRLAETLKALAAHNSETDQALGGLKNDLGIIQEFNKSTGPKITTLVDASRQISAQSSQIQLDLQQSIQKMDANQAQVDLANKKLAKLIEILKTIAVEQGKIDQVLQAQGEIKSIVNQGADKVLQGQGEIKSIVNQGAGKVLQGQGEIKSIVNQGADKVLQGQGEIKSIVSQGGMEKVLEGQGKLIHSQGEVKDALADLRRKANVNISRNDDILKAMKKQNKSSAGAVPPSP